MKIEHHVILQSSRSQKPFSFNPAINITTYVTWPRNTRDLYLNSYPYTWITFVLGSLKMISRKTYIFSKGGNPPSKKPMANLTFSTQKTAAPSMRATLLAPPGNGAGGRSSVGWSIAITLLGIHWLKCFNYIYPPRKFNMTMESHQFLEEIHLQMVVFPLSC